MPKYHGRRRSIWTVITGGQVGPPDDQGHRIHIRPTATNFSSKRRAKSFAGNIKGAEVSRSTKPFWTLPRVVMALVVVALVVVLCF